MEVIKNVDLVKKANIYFDGNVTSRAFIDSDGAKKSLGIMMPGVYNFGTNEPELMEIIEFGGSVRITGSTGANLDSSRSHAIL